MSYLSWEIPAVTREFKVAQLACLEAEGLDLGAQCRGLMWG